MPMYAVSFRFRESRHDHPGGNVEFIEADNEQQARLKFSLGSHPDQIIKRVRLRVDTRGGILGKLIHERKEALAKGDKERAVFLKNTIFGMCYGSPGAGTADATLADLTEVEVRTINARKP